MCERSNRHNIPTHTPQSGYHGVTELTKTANTPKMAEKSINCTNARPTRPIQTPWSWDPETLFRLKIEKNQKIHDFPPKKRGVIFMTPLPSSSKPKKSGFQVGGGRRGGPDHKLMGGCVYWTK